MISVIPYGDLFCKLNILGRYWQDKSVFRIFFIFSRFYQSLKVLHLRLLAEVFQLLVWKDFLLTATRSFLPLPQHHHDEYFLFCYSSCKTEGSAEPTPLSEILPTASNTWSIQAWEFCFSCYKTAFQWKDSELFLKTPSFQFKDSDVQTSEFLVTLYRHGSIQETDWLKFCISGQEAHVFN